MTALEKILRAAGTPDLPRDDPAAGLALAACTAVSRLRVLLAKDTEADEDGDDDSKEPDSKDSDGGHDSHSTYKALIKKGVKPAMAAKMCAKADNKVEACALADSAAVLLSALFEDGLVVELSTPASETASGRKKAAAKGHALDDGSYPIEDKKHLHKAAVLAASGHGDAAAAKRLIRKRARELGVDVGTLPGFGGSSDRDEKVAATMVALAASQAVPLHHPPFTGKHTHGHQATSVHEHEHQHFGDNSHDGGPAHRPGSQPRPGMAW